MILKIYLYMYIYVYIYMCIYIYISIYRYIDSNTYRYRLGRNKRSGQCIYIYITNILPEWG